jgi:peptidoglycan/LPS O-acetylase OafA/YrhL
MPNIPEAGKGRVQAVEPNSDLSTDRHEAITAIWSGGSSPKPQSAPAGCQDLPKAIFPSSSSQGKLLALEVIRFFSAFSVLIWHYQHFSFVGDHAVNYIRENSPYYSIFNIFYESGFYGVEVFWCISGFIFFWKYRDLIGNRQIGARRFFLLRFSRLYPLHIITLLFVAILQSAYLGVNGYNFTYTQNSFLSFVSQFFMASDWIVDFSDGFNGPVWSISLEVLVYFVFFLILRFVSRSITVNILVLGICLGAKVLRFSSPVVDCFAFFYIGGLSAIFLKSSRTYKYRNASDYIVLLSALTLPFLAWYFSLTHFKYFIYLSLMAYLPIIFFIFARDFRINTTMQKIFEAAGNMTYASYLIHFPIQLSIALYYSIIKQQIPFYSPYLFLFFLISTLSLSYLIYKYFEMPAQAMIRGRYGATQHPLDRSGSHPPPPHAVDAVSDRR